MTRQYEKRYALMQEKLDLLSITDVSTSRQKKNGTIVWRLPIKYSTHPKFIEVASFATGYVRNQNGGYSNYQLNKRVDKEGYYPEHTMTQGHCVKTGKFIKYNTRSCELIPREIDRLEYLIGYCLKNYYIKKANEVINGDFIPKWTHEYDLRKQQEKMEEICHVDANHQFVINELQNKLANSVPKWKYDEAMELGSMQECHYDRIQELEKELSTYKGDVIPEWKYTDAMTKIQDLEVRLELRGQSVRDLEDQVYDLENKLSNAISATKYECAKSRTQCLENTIKNLQAKLQSIIRTARH